MLVRFVDKNNQTLCFRHAVLAVSLRGEEVIATAGEHTEMGYSCYACLVEDWKLRELNERREAQHGRQV